MLGFLPQDGAARTEETLVWTEKSSGEFASLLYGPLDPNKTPVFMLSCFDEMGIAVLDVRMGTGGVKPGEPLTIELAAGDAKAPVEGEAAHDEANNIVFGEASDVAVQPILAVLRAPGPLTVSIGKTSATLSDLNRAQATDNFSKNCTLD
jgi:hypothetical protein